MATLMQVLQHVLEQKDPLLPAETKRIVLKEALQAYVLDFVYNHPSYRHLKFYGGTCLHVVYELNRLSEDLDLDNNMVINLSDLANELSSMFTNRLGYPDTVVKTQQGENEILRVTLKFPVLNTLGLSAHPDEALHLKVEVSHHRQVSIIQNTPVFYHGCSFVPAHFSLETMMAGKMIACLERNFQRGREGAFIKGRDFYDLLWFMQKKVQPLDEKLARDAEKPYTIHSAMEALRKKVAGIRVDDLAVDLLPMFESRAFINSWLEHFHANFERYVKDYLLST
jgi:predicted nucleotidyltransferase component of viral defense system